MALIKCSECGKEMSDNAKSCPHCGNKRRVKWSKKKKIIFWVVFSLLVGLIILFVALNLYNEYENDKYWREYYNSEEYKQEQLKQEKWEKYRDDFLNYLYSHIYNFKDPNSVSILWAYKLDGIWVCSIRATNTYGGFVTDTYIQQGDNMYDWNNKNITNALRKKLNDTPSDQREYWFTSAETDYINKIIDSWF